MISVTDVLLAAPPFVLHPVDAELVPPLHAADLEFVWMHDAALAYAEPASIGFVWLRSVTFDAVYARTADLEFVFTHEGTLEC